MGTKESICKKYIVEWKKEGADSVYLTVKEMSSKEEVLRLDGREADGLKNMLTVKNKIGFLRAVQSFLNECFITMFPGRRIT